VREELEYWNVIYVLRRLNDYYRYKLRFKVNKELQGLEAKDFVMLVMEKIISGDYSWERSSKSSFIDFVFDVARGEISHFNRANKNREFVSFDDMDGQMVEYYRLPDNYNGF
jgi:hypothetical protein